MTRKDYQLIAQILRKSRAPHMDTETLNELAYTFADELEWENPRFDRKRFLVASGALDEQMSEIMAQLQD